MYMKLTENILTLMMKDNCIWWWWWWWYSLTFTELLFKIHERSLLAGIYDWKAVMSIYAARTVTQKDT